MLGIGLYVFLGIIALLFIIVVTLAIVTLVRSKTTGRAPFGGDSRQGGVGENYDEEQRLAAKDRDRGYNYKDSEARRRTGTQ